MVKLPFGRSAQRATRYVLENQLHRALERVCEHVCSGLLPYASAVEDTRNDSETLA